MNMFYEDFFLYACLGIGTHVVNLELRLVKIEHCTQCAKKMDDFHFIECLVHRNFFGNP